MTLGSAWAAAARFVAGGLPEATAGGVGSIEWLICGLLLTRGRQTKVGAIHR